MVFGLERRLFPRQPNEPRRPGFRLRPCPTRRVVGQRPAVLPCGGSLQRRTRLSRQLRLGFPSGQDQITLVSSCKELTLLPSGGKDMHAACLFLWARTYRRTPFGARHGRGNSRQRRTGFGGTGHPAVPGAGNAERGSAVRGNAERGSAVRGNAERGSAVRAVHIYANLISRYMPATATHRRFAYIYIPYMPRLYMRFQISNAFTRRTHKKKTRGLPRVFSCKA